jgi:hypothetical protein
MRADELEAAGQCAEEVSRRLHLHLFSRPGVEKKEGKR